MVNLKLWILIFVIICSVVLIFLLRKTIICNIVAFFVRQGWLHQKANLTEEEFQDYVFDILCKHFPKQVFKKSDNPNLIIMESHVSRQISLQNLYRFYLLPENSIEDTIRYIIGSFDSVIRLQTKEKDKLVDMSSWDIAKGLLRPQLMPRDYKERYGVISRTFYDNIEIGYVLDHPDTYEYVTEKTLSLWEKSFKEVDEQALQNLATIAENIPIEVSEENHTIMFDGTDGYVAVRILLPSVREKFAKYLGETFFVGIPNRDFMVCWGKNVAPEIQENLRQQIQIDVETRPYPLTSRIFIASEGEIKPEK